MLPSRIADSVSGLRASSMASSCSLIPAVTAACRAASARTCRVGHLEAHTKNCSMRRRTTRIRAARSLPAHGEDAGEEAVVLGMNGVCATGQRNAMGLAISGGHLSLHASHPWQEITHMR